ncbi:DgyrCDS14922 [Dimorphilus gyrociliatus]|uniref:DgyrCDS14922 n=1 Tax=Dimorphilus gyrociliatus TaxID=2664684 RepID=A0A7I8WFC5_9ANNE|nr:DgyrCDS14922 [Dimorphilus gyrociliatus]
MAIDPNSHEIVLDIKYLLHQEFQNFTLDGDFNFMDENVPNGIYFYHDAKYDVNRKSSLKLFSKWHETHNGEGKFTLKIFQPEILCSVQFVRETCVFKYEENCSIYKLEHSTYKKDLGENEEVKNQFKKTVKSFDLLLLQEVAKDKKKLPNFSEILRSINTELVSNGESPYYALVGKEYHNCERYFLLYNTKYLVCSKCKEYEDKEKEKFSRPPLIATFQTKYCQVDKFTFIPLHSRPDKEAKGKYPNFWRII